jgi:hypothetical protein
MRSRAHTTAFVQAFALVATLYIGQEVARADAPAPTPPAQGAAARKAATKHSPPVRAHEASAGDQSLYACHPKEDLSCTVIHETTQGIVVVTFRPTGAKEKREWSVVNAPAEASESSTGGTIYVVPGSAPTATVAQPTTRFSENNTPILD